MQYGLVQFSVLFENFTCAYLFQIAREKLFDYLQERTEGENLTSEVKKISRAEHETESQMEKLWTTGAFGFDTPPAISSCVLE